MGNYIATPFGNLPHAVTGFMNSSVGLAVKKTYRTATYIKGRNSGGNRVKQYRTRGAIPG